MENSLRDGTVTTSDLHCVLKTHAWHHGLEVKKFPLALLHLNDILMRMFKSASHCTSEKHFRPELFS
jgi:hypothetical protein